MESMDKERIIKEYAQHTGDTGSAAVQVAILTHEIKHLTGHCQRNKKDHSSKRGLLKKVCRRRRFLSYIRENNAQEYTKLVERLGLRH